jgi:hypothetical protein
VLPLPVCDEIHQLEHGGEHYFLHITVTAEPSGASAGPVPARADLGKRIADLIRADCGQGVPLASR